MMILEMGSNQFQAHLENGMLTLDVIEGPANGATITIPQAGKVTIGRKSNNLLNFPNDQHLSNCHSEILSLNNNYYIADLNTTNGTWERLSREGESSTQF